VPSSAFSRLPNFILDLENLDEIKFEADKIILWKKMAKWQLLFLI